MFFERLLKAERTEADCGGRLEADAKRVAESEPKGR